MYSLLSIAYSRGDWSRVQHHGLTAQPLKCRQRNHALIQFLWSTFLPVPMQNNFLNEHTKKTSQKIVLGVHKSDPER